MFFSYYLPRLTLPKSTHTLSALVFFSMCRFTLTMVRNTWLGRKFLALDMIVDIHKGLGIVYAVMTLIHAVAHIFTFSELRSGRGFFSFHLIIAVLRRKRKKVFRLSELI